MITQFKIYEVYNANSKRVQKSPEQRKLEKLYKYLKAKGLEVKFNSVSQIYPYRAHYSIGGEDFLIFLENKVENDSFAGFYYDVHYMVNPVTDDKGDRRAKWISKIFYDDEGLKMISEVRIFKMIYEFVKDIYLDNEVKKYNL